jgi:hypothetical protein
MTVLIHKRPIANQGDLESVQFTLTSDELLPEVQIGQVVSVFDFSHEGRSGQLTIWHDSGRAAIDLGEGIMWGFWDEDSETIMVDDGANRRAQFNSEGECVAEFSR